MNIYDIDNVGKVTIKKPIVHSDKYTVFELSMKNSDCILICTSKLQINFINNQSICLKDNSNFIDKLDSILQNIKNRLMKHHTYKELFAKKKYYSLAYKNSLKINNISQKDICVFDYEGSKSCYNYLMNCDNVACILYIKNCWVNESRFGFSIKISQIQRKEPLNLSKNLFNNIPLLSSTPTPPPPPPPPPSKIKKHSNKNMFFIDKKHVSEFEKLPNTIVRPSLHEILRSKNKLRKTNNL